MIPHTSTVESSCKALKGLFIGLDAEREGEELVGNVHDCLAGNARKIISQCQKKMVVVKVVQMVGGRV